MLYWMLHKLTTNNSCDASARIKIILETFLLINTYRIMKQYFLILSVLSTCLTAGCDNNHKDEEYPENSITKNGIIKYYPPPDNCNDYIILIDDEIYKPDYLQEAFKQDDLQVKVTYTITDKEHNCGFIRYKPVIHIIKIKKL